MRSSFLGLEMSKRSIQIAQKSLDIAGHNLGNASTEGYTRQRVDTYSMYLNGAGAWTGTAAKFSLGGQGVGASGVSQIRDSYVDKRYREINCYAREYERKHAVMSEAETALDNVENTGLTQRLDKLKSALTKYAANAPDNEELASIVRNEAYNICSLLNGYSDQLQQLKEANVTEINNAVDQTNDLIDKIVSLNKQIVTEYKATECDKTMGNESVSRYGPLELMDQRNLLIDELSGFVNIRAENNADGSVNIFMGNQSLIEGSKTNHLILQNYDDYGAAVLDLSDGSPANILSGEIKAYIDVLNGNGPYANYYQNSEYGIPYYQTAIDTFAQDFAVWMNVLNGAPKDEGFWYEDPGYRNDWPYPAVQYPERDDELQAMYDKEMVQYDQRALFTSYDDVYDSNGNLTARGAITAANIRVSKTWLVNATMIGQVQSSDGSWGYSTNLDGTHDNQLLLGMESEIPFGRATDFTGTPYEYVSFLSNRLGQSLSFTEELHTNAITTSEELLNRRDSVSAVSETEEGINMMSYQKWFNASSRLMTALDECLDKIINSMGRVGL
jgi:flagellar hook-associated protein 1 FlgK